MGNKIEWKKCFVTAALLSLLIAKALFSGYRVHGYGMPFGLFFDIGIIRDSFILGRMMDFILLRLIVVVVAGQFFLKYILSVRYMLVTRTGADIIYAKAIRKVFSIGSMYFALFMGIILVLDRQSNIPTPLEVLGYYLMWQSFIMLVNIVSMSYELKYIAIAWIILEMTMNVLLNMLFFDYDYVYLYRMLHENSSIQLLVSGMLMLVMCLINYIGKRTFVRKEFLEL